MNSSLQSGERINRSQHAGGGAAFALAAAGSPCTPRLVKRDHLTAARVALRPRTPRRRHGSSGAASEALSIKQAYLEA